MPAVLTLDIDTIGSIELTLDTTRTPNATAALLSMAAGGVTGRVHRAEPVPPVGSTGPPYALVQFSLNEERLASMPHEGNAKITRGSVCHIGGTSDLFVSLATRGGETAV